VVGGGEVGFEMELPSVVSVAGPGGLGGFVQMMQTQYLEARCIIRPFARSVQAIGQSIDAIFMSKKLN
jgi:hypothetical protein